MSINFIRVGYHWIPFDKIERIQPEIDHRGELAHYAYTIDREKLEVALAEQTHLCDITPYIGPGMEILFLVIDPRDGEVHVEELGAVTHVASGGFMKDEIYFGPSANLAYVASAEYRLNFYYRLQDGRYRPLSGHHFSLLSETDMKVQFRDIMASLNSLRKRAELVR